MTIVVALAKYKEKDNALAAIVSFLLFFATIIGLQVNNIYSTFTFIILLSVVLLLTVVSSKTTGM